MRQPSDKVIISLPDGRNAEAQAPVIVSASRSTDIPAFYADWFFRRLEEGYSIWKNPFNGRPVLVSYAATRFIVFWSKNPRPLLRHLGRLKERGIGCYVHFSLNDYVREGYEPNVPPVEQRLDTFRSLAETLGLGGVIWRNDPLLMTDRLGMDELLRRAERIGDALKGHTEKLVFSFADISPVAAANLRRAGVAWRAWTVDSMKEYSKELSRLNEKWGYALATCAEAVDLDEFGIAHNHCVDEELIIRRGYKDAALMKHLGVKVVDPASFLCPVPKPAGALDLGGGLYALKSRDNRDKGQRTACGCIRSKDIGEYSTCRHFCVYCYANAAPKKVLENCAFHVADPNAASITGTIAAPVRQA
ncbi:MAG: DUF1848 domain-containing protein [Desulfovibrionaceae bacterium]|nr:DUF1848 domain-containing protein [Desulfovibrionaceae bacterium]